MQLQRTLAQWTLIPTVVLYNVNWPLRKAHWEITIAWLKWEIIVRE